MQDSRKGNLWVWVGIVALVVIVLFAIFWKSPGATDVSVVNPAYAPQGQAVQGFPTDLILDPQAKISSSYSITQSASGNQYTAQYASAIAPAALMNTYEQYFQANGWTVSANPTTQPTVQGLSAATSSAYVLLTIVTQGTGSQVTVGYVMQ